MVTVVSFSEKDNKASTKLKACFPRTAHSTAHSTPTSTLARFFQQKMSTLKITDLNNGGVSALQQGRHKDAVCLLRTALADLKERFVVPAPSSSIQPPNALSQDKPSIFSEPIWNEETTTQQQDKTSIFMYSQALVLADDEDHCKELLVGVVFYNMALVNHARAIETGKASLLTAALNFYGMAVAVTQSRNDVTQSRNDGVNASDYWLLLAVSNNMAHIYLTQVCSERLCQCLDNIRSLLATNIAVEVVDAGDYYFFVANSLLQIRVNSAPAA